MSSSFEKSVKGGTKIKLAPPKSKYVEHILLATQAGEAGVAEVFRTLRDRLRDSTWTIVFKSLIIVHLMIKEGEKDVTLKYLSASPKRNLAINTFTDVQTQGQNIRRYSNYLVQRAQSYSDTHIDYVRSGTGRMKALSIDKGLLRETESVQAQIRALLKCNILDNEPENEISLMAFRLLTKDLLDLFTVMNEAVMNVLSHYFELSKPDAEHAIEIYKTFAKQTDQVVQYLSIARQYEHVTKLEIPKIKHAPTSLAASLQEYIDDNDFEVNRRQYLAEKQAKSGSKFSNDTSSKAFSTSKPAKSSAKAEEAGFPAAEAFGSSEPVKTDTAQPAAKGPAPDLIDFFGSIEQNQQPMSQASTQQYAQPTAQAQPQTYVQQPANGAMPTGVVSTNPFGQPQQAQYQAQQIQPNFTGAGFGGYGPQPQQQAAYSTNPFPEAMQQPNVPQPQQVFTAPQPEPQPHPELQLQLPSQQQMQPQSTNPFRQSMMMTGQMTGFQAPQQQLQQSQPQPQQSTNPFTRSAPKQNTMQTGQFGSQPVQQLMPQQTGTNPFARQAATPQQQPQQTGSPATYLTPSATGSTNPFRQSAFVNQQTGTGWQTSTPQGTMGGWEQLDTRPVFPRPGQ
ncbi:hypothetical protein MBLNU459_g4031t1 [Dothideomycetes sp. NU459]